MLQFTEEYRKQGDVIIASDQAEGINFLLSHKSGILAFGTGTGKTLCSVVALKIILDKFKDTKGVIVVPVKALKAFKRELQRVGYTDDEVGIISTHELHFDEIANKLFVFTDTNIDKYDDLLVELAARKNKLVLIIDEAHKLQEPDSKFYQTMNNVKSICTIVWGLTATPILNDLDSLYNIVNFFCPKFLGTKTDFNNRYTVWHLRDQYVRGGAKRKVKELDGYKNLKELNERLKQVMIVRQRQYNLKFGNISRELTNEEYKIYEKVSAGIMTSKDEKRDFTKRLHDLQRYVDNSYAGDDLIEMLVDNAGITGYSTKESMFLDTLKVTLDKGYSVIVYADYHDTVYRLDKVLMAHKQQLNLGTIHKVTGKINIKLREQVEEKIGDRDVILITSAGSESINLQRANCIIFYDIPFSVKTIIQVVGRVCRRDTRHKYQYIITLFTKGTIDEYKYLSFQNNLSMVQQSVGAGNDLPLDQLDVDKKAIKALKDKMLWHYKGGAKKVARKQKKALKDNLAVANIIDAEKEIARNKFIVEPMDAPSSDYSVVDVLMPDKKLYIKFINGEIPFTILRANYLEYLRSGKGRQIISTIHNQLQSKPGVLLLVGNTEIPSVLMQEILDQYEI